MGGFTTQMAKAATLSAIIGSFGLGIAHLVTPGPMAELWDSIQARVGWTAHSCATVPLTCLNHRVEGLRTRRAEVHAARVQAEAGLRALDAEETRVRNLLDANRGHQSLLRSRANEVIGHSADRFSFAGRTYTLSEAAAQAASLAAEQQQSEKVLSGVLPPRRETLLKARQQAMLVENMVFTTLATVDADRALLLASRSMDRADQLLAEVADTVQRSNEALGSVRNTLELTAAEDRSQPAPGYVPAPGTFDFNAWRTGRPPPGG